MVQSVSTKPPPDDAGMLTALVVDDDELILKLMVTILTDLGVRVRTTTKSYGLLNLIAEIRPALVILDVKLPGLDGFSLVKLVRADPGIAGTTILLHSAMDENLLAQRAKECGADGHIAKTRGVPFLRRSLETWLRR